MNGYRKSDWAKISIFPNVDFVRKCKWSVIFMSLSNGIWLSLCVTIIFILVSL